MIETLILKRVRALINDPTCWTQRAMARNMFGTDISALDPKATCWCIMGAIQHETQDDPFLAGSVYEIVRTQLQGQAVSEFNDDRTTRHGDVLSVLDKAIKSSERVQ